MSTLLCALLQGNPYDVIWATGQAPQLCCNAIPGKTSEGHLDNARLSYTQIPTVNRLKAVLLLLLSNEKCQRRQAALRIDFLPMRLSSNVNSVRSLP